MNISVLARPALTESDRNVRLEAYDVRHDFRLVDIVVEARETRYERAPYFREGFTLSLEEGMTEQVAVYLPRIDLISLVAAGVGEAIKPMLGCAPAPHEQAVIADVVASTVRDRRPTGRARSRAAPATFGLRRSCEDRIYAACRLPRWSATRRRGRTAESRAAGL
ncbi:hypothetical protein [Burkholderia sp. LMG 21824]|uniref:hypothetical protein n=1 Tax=Burkholderia sp. LMG 21824 TaxID=3158172 RepID=UPI003C2F9E11